MIITSLDNDKIKHVIKLKEKKYRIEYQEFVVETFHLIEEAYKKNILKQLIILEDAIVPFDVPYIYVSKQIMKHLSDLDTPSNMIGICTIKEGTLEGSKLLILDNIQDPGNLGTIIRSSVAFGVDTLILGNKTVDLYNSKVIRASEGMMFHLNVIKKDLNDFLPKLKTQGYQIIGTKVNGGTDVKDVLINQKCAIIIGNEGSGVSNNLLSLCDNYVYIHMNSSCESLNAGVAASIILYELYKEM